MPTYEYDSNDDIVPSENIELGPNILTEKQKREFLKIDRQRPGNITHLLNYLNNNKIEASRRTASNLLQKLKEQNEAQKPPSQREQSSQRGQSEPANTIVNGIAIGNLVKAHQLKEMREINEKMDEMTEDVDDVNGGFEFDF